MDQILGDLDPNTPEQEVINTLLGALDANKSPDEILVLLNELEVPGYIARSILADTYDEDSRF